MTSATLQPTPHVGLARCALAILMVSICLPSAVIGIGAILEAIIFVDAPSELAAGGYADYPIIAAHQLTVAGALSWAQWHLLPVLGLATSAVLLRGRSPRWLARATGASQ